jgi:hypothetical protein
MYRTYHNLSVETICNCLNEVFEISLNQSKIFRYLKQLCNTRIYFDCKTKEITLFPKETTFKILEISHPFVNFEVDKLRFKNVYDAGIIYKNTNHENENKHENLCEYLSWYDTILNVTQRKNDIKGFKTFIIEMKIK